MMPTWCLEMRSTADWSDVRYRAYTSSVKRKMRFEQIPRIRFSDSEHGIVPVVGEKRGRRLPEIAVLRDYVEEHTR